MSHFLWSERRGALQATHLPCRKSACRCRKNDLPLKSGWHHTTMRCCPQTRVRRKARMTDAKKDPEVGALEAVHTALKVLDASARQRVLASVYALLDIIPPAPKTQGQGSGRPIEQAGRPQTGRPVSPVELIKEKKPTSNVEKITLFAYYRDRHEGVSRFARDELRPYFAKAHETMPG